MTFTLAAPPPAEYIDATGGDPARRERISGGMADAAESFLDGGVLKFRNFYDERSFEGGEPAGSAERQESHMEREILMVVSGKSGFLLDGRRRAAAPGDVFFIDRWVPHQGGYGTIKNDFTHIWVHLHADRLFGVICRNPPRPEPGAHRSWDFGPGVLALLNERWERALAASSAPERREIYRGMARILAEEIAYTLSRPAPAAGTRAPRVAAWIKDYISMHCGRDSSLDELERLTGYNRFHLMRRFKAEYGMTIGEYVNCVRRGFVAAAARKMRQKEIAAQLGFKSAAAFWLWKTRDRRRRS